MSTRPSCCYSTSPSPRSPACGCTTRTPRGSPCGLEPSRRRRSSCWRSSQRRRDSARGTGDTQEGRHGGDTQEGRHGGDTEGRHGGDAQEGRRGDVQEAYTSVDETKPLYDSREHLVTIVNVDNPLYQPANGNQGNHVAAVAHGNSDGGRGGEELSSRTADPFPETHPLIHPPPQKAKGTVERLKHHLVAVAKFVMKQSYVCALIAMMAWSITDHSWLTFVLLIWSCVLWMMRDRRRHAMRSSPVLVAYATTLCTLRYVWSLELRPDELPAYHGVLRLCSPAASHNNCTFMGSMLLYTLTFWVLLRQFITERRAERKNELMVQTGMAAAEEAELKGEKESVVVRMIGGMVMGVFIKYWIYVCGGMFFFVSLEGRMVVYKIIYMVLFLSCVALYQVYYSLWRRVLKWFWVVVVSYTMMVLIAIYTFQFDDLPPLWMSMTRLNIDQLKDLGLEKFTTANLFTRILLPTAFLLCCILQLHYFHDRFLQLTDLNRVWRNEESVAYRMATDEGSLPDLSLIPDKGSGTPGPGVTEVTPGERTAEPRHHGDEEEEEEDDEEEEDEEANKWRLVLDRLSVLLLRSMELLRWAQGLAWRLLELHIIKLASFYTVWVALREVSLLNYALLIAWGFALPFPRVRRAASATCAVWVSVVVVGKMLYQLHIVNSATFSTNCTVSGGGWLAVWVSVVVVGKMLYQLHIVNSATFSTNCTVSGGGCLGL
ncbi:piezo-type mechanosensitive ion channel component 2-like [Petromyzon marinus]|uniref:piezo-type mechanosensitive ion channel component 2-like n=1 Tax=Petromyzon marinus TaxID=7757 RepID=UPI003F705304